MPINWWIFDKAGDEINEWRDRAHARDMNAGPDAQPLAPPTRLAQGSRVELDDDAQLEQPSPRAPMTPASELDDDDDEDDLVDDKAPWW